MRCRRSIGYLGQQRWLLAALFLFGGMIAMHFL
jgi:hypothetical protein